MTILTQEDGYRIQQQNYDLKAEIERLRAALSAIETKAQTALDNLADHSACAYACRDIVGMCDKELIEQTIAEDKKC